MHPYSSSRQRPKSVKKAFILGRKGRKEEYGMCTADAWIIYQKGTDYD